MSEHKLTFVDAHTTREDTHEGAHGWTATSSCSGCRGDSRDGGRDGPGGFSFLFTDRLDPTRRMEWEAPDGLIKLSDERGLREGGSQGVKEEKRRESLRTSHSVYTDRSYPMGRSGLFQTPLCSVRGWYPVVDHARVLSWLRAWSLIKDFDFFCLNDTVHV